MTTVFEVYDADQLAKFLSNFEGEVDVKTLGGGTWRVWATPRPKPATPSLGKVCDGCGKLTRSVEQIGDDELCTSCAKEVVEGAEELAKARNCDAQTSQSPCPDCGSTEPTTEELPPLLPDYEPDPAKVVGMIWIKAIKDSQEVCYLRFFNRLGQGFLVEATPHENVPALAKYRWVRQFGDWESLTEWNGWRCETEAGEIMLAWCLPGKGGE